MSEQKVPFLCGGVLLLLLFESCYEDHNARDHRHGLEDDHSGPKVMTDFVSIFHYDQIPVSDTAASEFRSCKKNGSSYIPFDKQSTIDDFDDQVKNHYQQAIESVRGFVSKHINPKKYNWLATTLIEVIESDQEILEGDLFYLHADGTPATKAEIRTITECALEPLILGVLHYTMLNRSKMNTLGTKTLSEWSSAGRGKKRVYTRKTKPGSVRGITAYSVQPPTNDPLNEETTDNGKPVQLDLVLQTDQSKPFRYKKNSSSREEPYTEPFFNSENADRDKDSRDRPNVMRANNVTQTGDNNIYVEQNNGVINMVSSRTTLQQTASDLLAIRNFSQEYYQLIVTGEEIFEANALVVRPDRALVKGTVPDEIYEACSSLSPEGQEIMVKIPAIICNENTGYHGQTDPEQNAIYARLEKIKVGSSGIKIYYRPLDLFPQRILNENSIDFGIRCDSALTELNRSCWSVKKINLFEAFLDVGLDNIKSPM